MTLRPNVPAAVSQCEFCLKCVKLCQEQAVNVRLDLPVAGLWKSDTLDSRMSPILFSLFVVAGIVFASDSKLLSGIQMTALTAASVVFGIVLNRLCDRLFVRERSVDPSLTARIAGALVVVAWGTLLADQLGHLAGLRQIRIVIAGNGVGIAATSALQLIVLVTTLALASIALVKAFHRVKRLGARAPRWKRAIVGQIVLIEAVAAVFIVYTTA